MIPSHVVLCVNIWTGTMLAERPAGRACIHSMHVPHLGCLQHSLGVHLMHFIIVTVIMGTTSFCEGVRLCGACDPRGIWHGAGLPLYPSLKLRSRHCALISRAKRNPMSLSVFCRSNVATHFVNIIINVAFHLCTTGVAIELLLLALGALVDGLLLTLSDKTASVCSNPRRVGSSERRVSRSGPWAWAASSEDAPAVPFTTLGRVGWLKARSG